MSPRSETALILALLAAMVVVPVVGGAYALRKRRTPRFDPPDSGWEEREMARFSGARRTSHTRRTLRA